MFGFIKAKLSRGANRPEGVKPSTVALLEELGWTKTSRGWAGPIKTKYGQWPGIVELAGDRPKAYIRYLPSDLREHSKGLSFQEQASGWFRIELAVSLVASDADVIIRYVERVLVSAGDAMSGTQQELQEAA